MSAHDQIKGWIEEKLEQTMCGVCEFRQITHVWKRALGAGNSYAGLTLSVKPAEEFSFTINGSVPDDYQAAIRNGVFSFLMGHSFTPILRMNISVIKCDVHEMDSNYAAFFKVANEAIKLALGAESNYSNIRYGNEMTMTEILPSGLAE